jgi:small-conductance mechanosensitive channel
MIRRPITVSRKAFRWLGLLWLGLLWTACPMAGFAAEPLAQEERPAVGQAAAPSLAHRAPIPPESALHRFFLNADARRTLLADRVREIAANLPSLPADVQTAFRRVAGEGTPGAGSPFGPVLGFVALLGLGFGLERGARTALARWKKQAETNLPTCVVTLFYRLLSRTALECLGAAIFLAGIAGGLLLFFSVSGPVYLLTMTFLPGIAVLRLAAIFLDFLYSPWSAQMRLAPHNCLTSRLYFRAILAFVAIALLGPQALLLLRSRGLSEPSFLTLYAGIGLLEFAVLLTVVWKDRKQISRRLGGTGPAGGLPESGEREAGETAGPEAAGTPSRAAAGIDSGRAKFHLPIAVLALVAFEFTWQYHILVHQNDLTLPLAITVFSVPMGMLIYGIGNRLLLIAMGRVDLLDPRALNRDILPAGTDPGRFFDFPLPPDPAADPQWPPPIPEPLRRILPVLQRLLAVLLGGTLFFWIMDLWGMDLPLGQSLFRSAFAIFSVLLLAYALWEIFRQWVDARLAEEIGNGNSDSGDGEGGAEGSRLGTLLSLLRKFALAALSGTVILFALGTLGIDIGPLVAGAGILGLAVGFGSQALVKDILSGVFYLADDAFRVGEYIEAAGTKGMVERISLRSVKLRHPRGMVYTIPYGDMGSIQNFSRDYIITKLNIRVRFDADIEKIRKIIKKIGKELKKDDEIGPVLLDKVKSQGVREMDDSALIIRVKFKTIPGEQFVVRREVYRRIQEAFRENGIEFAHRNVTVHLPETASGNGSNEDSQTGGGLPSGDFPGEREQIVAGSAALAVQRTDREKEKRPALGS